MERILISTDLWFRTFLDDVNEVLPESFQLVQTNTAATMLPQNRLSFA
jgi:hypothetical protein